MIRILIVVEARTVAGSVKPVLEFAREASKPNAAVPMEITFLTFARHETENPLTHAVQAAGLEIDVIQERFPFDWKVLPQLREAVLRRKPDVLWSNSVKSHFLVRLAGLHKLTNWLVFHHGYTTTAFRTRCYNLLDYWSHRGAAQVVTVCENFRDLLASQGVARNKIAVQHSSIRQAGPVDENTVRATRQSLGLSDETPVVLTVGRLSQEKGQDSLVRAMAEVRQKVPGVKLLIAGDGPERNALLALRTSLGLEDTVVLLGHQDNVRVLYGVAQVFALPSHSEGSPNVLLEAMDAGAVVVASAVGGIPEMAEDGVNALLVPARNDAALASALVRVLMDPALRQALTKQARAGLDQYSPEKYFKNLSAVLAAVAKTGGVKSVLVS